MKNILRVSFIRIGLVLALPLALAACESNGKTFPNYQLTGSLFKPDPPVIRQPVLP